MVVTRGKGHEFVALWESDWNWLDGGLICILEEGLDILVSPTIYDEDDDSLNALEAAWADSELTLFIEDQPVNLKGFGTIDFTYPDIPSPLRAWNVIIRNLKPGEFISRVVGGGGGEDFDYKVTVKILPGADRSPAGIPPSAEGAQFAGRSAAFSTLADFMDLLNTAVEEEQVEPFWKVVAASDEMPLVFGDHAVFLYRSEADHVTARGDFNLQYTRQGTTDLWLAIKQFEPQARVEYSIWLNYRQAILDPMNPHSEKGGLGTKSVLMMPGYETPACASQRSDIHRGKFSEDVSCDSQHLGYRVNYRVYTPSGYQRMENLPVIYVTDAGDYTRPGMGAMVNILDNMIADGQVEPIMAVFIDPCDPETGENRRAKELIPEGPGNCPFADFIVHELVPVIDATYPTSPSAEGRAILGFSLGGWFSAYMGLTHGDIFHKIGIQSPHILSGEWIFEGYNMLEGSPIKIFINHGTYDKGAASPRLRGILDDRGIPTHYIEKPEGHSYGLVRGVLGDMLVYFFGVEDM